MVAEKIIRALEPQLVWAFSHIDNYEESLGPDDDWVQRDRRYLYETADRFLRPLGRPTIREVGQEDKLFTVEESVNDVEECIHPKYSRNLISSRKYREHHSGGRQWAKGSWVYDPKDTDWQHHVYLFPSKDGGTDVYAHKEPSVRLPAQHHLHGGKSGDPDGVLHGQLDNCNIEY
jgi:hypothetical protein